MTGALNLNIDVSANTASNDTAVIKTKATIGKGFTIYFGLISIFIQPSGAMTADAQTVTATPGTSLQFYGGADYSRTVRYGFTYYANGNTLIINKYYVIYFLWKLLRLTCRAFGASNLPPPPPPRGRTCYRF